LSKRIWFAAIGVSLTLLLAGCGQANSPSASSPTPTQQGGTTQNGNPQGHPNISPQQRQQMQQELRSGKVVSLTASSVTVAVDRGGADVGTNATYNLTSSTVVRKDRATVSTSGQTPDLASLGLKSGYYATLLVNGGNVISIQFNSDGSQSQRPRNGNGAPPSQNESAPSQ